MVTVQRGFEVMSDRYKYDFRLLTYDRGWAQVDTRQDASYYGTWTNPTTLEIFNYCEGDTTLTKCETDTEYVGELRKTADWNKEAGYWLGIDPGGAHCQVFTARFTALGMADLLH